MKCLVPSILVALAFQARSAVPPGPDCVTIGTPKPGVGYVMRHDDPGGRTVSTQYWDSVTPTESRVRVVKAGQTLTQTNVYTVVDDVARLTRMTQAIAGRVSSNTRFQPALVSDPFQRACAGRSWAVPSVTLSFDGPTNATSQTPAGSLAIIAIREKLTVPAGTFDTVHYVRRSQSNDEYWKSTLHGVIVRHVGRVAGHVVIEELIAIK